MPGCQCDSRGTQINDYDGDWCWLKESPCQLLTATVVDVSFTWVPCENKYGVNQIECKGNKIFTIDKMIIPHDELYPYELFHHTD